MSGMSGRGNVAPQSVNVQIDEIINDTFGLSHLCFMTMGVIAPLKFSTKEGKQEISHSNIPLDTSNAYVCMPW